MLRRQSGRRGPGGGRAPSLLFVNQYYAPDVAATGQILGDLAEHLAARGYAVSVLASRGGYAAARRDGRAAEERNGVAVSRVGGTAFGRKRHAGRIADYAAYYARALVRVLAGPRYDGVVFLTTPPLLGVVGWLGRVLRGQRYGVWSMDLHPEAEVAAGMLRPGSPVVRVLRGLNALAYGGADFVVDLGPYMRRRIAAAGGPPERAHTVHVWSTGEEVVPIEPAANPLVRELGLEGRFVVMYSGNAGMVHEFGPVLEAMRILRDDPRVYFLFVGDGPQRARIEAFAREHAVPNFAYRDYFPREALHQSLSLAGAHLVTLRDAFVGIAVPSKVYGAMAAARPVLFVGPAASEPAEAVTGAGCGVVVASGGADAGARLAAEIRALMGDEPRCRALGAAGRAAFLRHYDRAPNCEAFEAVIARAWGAPPEAKRRPATRPAAAAGAP
jgi:glycosyltransferase involved in cell wall biosynthesis